jgi:hypothetical protein
MATLQLTQIYLEREQKRGLQARAKANGTKVAEEVRRAVDAYLSGIGPEDLQLLDAGTQKAAQQLGEMAQELDRINRRLDAAFAELARKKAGRGAKDGADDGMHEKPKSSSRMRGHILRVAHAQRRRKRAA